MSGPHPFSVSTRRHRAIAVGLSMLAATLGTACSSGPERSTEGFCAAYIDVAAQAVKLASPDDVSIPTLREQIGDLDSAASDAAAKAPEAAADDVEAVIEPLGELRRALDDADTRAEATTALQQYRTDAHELAPRQRSLDSWVSAHCGVVSVTTTTAPITVAPGMTG